MHDGLVLFKRRERTYRNNRCWHRERRHAAITRRRNRAKYRRTEPRNRCAICGSRDHPAGEAANPIRSTEALHEGSGTHRDRSRRRGMYASGDWNVSKPPTRIYARGYDVAMRLAVAASAAAAVILLLSSCSAASPPDTAVEAVESPSATPSPTPTIDPGPVELTKKDAAERYLGIVCQRNSLVYQLNDAFDAQEDAFLSGGAGDVSEVKKIAAESMRVNRLAIEIIDDTYYTWPEGVAEHLKTIRQSYIALASYYDALTNAGSFEEAYYSTAPESGGAAAAQEIRYQLGLPADTTSSCKGKETMSDVLHQEMTKRNEYLTSFEEDETAS